MKLQAFRCFPVNIAKFLRTLIFEDHLRRRIGLILMRIGLALFRLPRFHFFKVTRKTNSSTKLTS